MNPFRPDLMLLLAAVLLQPLPAQRQPLPDGERTVALYDVRDLVRSETDPVIGDEPPPAGTTAPNDPARERLETLAAFLRTFIQPPLGRDDEVTLAGRGHLVVVAPAEQQAFVERFLAAQRRERGTGVFVDARFLSVPRAVFERDVAPLLESAPRAPGTTGDAAGGESVVLEAGEATDRFVQGLLGREGVKVDQAPRLLAEVLRPTELFVGSQVSYVKDFKVEVVKEAVIADPVVDVVRDGQVLRLVGARLEPGRLAVDLRAEVHALQRPIPTFTTKLDPLRGAGQPVTIQLPRVQVSRISTAVVLPDGAQVLVALPPLRVDHRVVVLLRANAVSTLGKDK